MRKKVIMYLAGSGFVMECGHTSPFYVMPNVNALRTFDRFNRRTLYRDCPICEVANNRVTRPADGGSIKATKV